MDDKHEKKERKDSRVADWSIRITATKEEGKWEDEAKVLRMWMRRNCKKWGFQLERGAENGYLHWQTQIRLKKAMTLTNLAAMMKADEKVSAMGQQGQHISRTSTTGKKQAWSYTAKPETRVLGPWTEEYTEPEDMAADVKLLERGKREWQQTMADMIEQYDEEKDGRLIHWVYDPIGKNGKNALIKWLRWKKLAKSVDLFPEVIDYSQWCHGQESNCYVMNIPRAGVAQKVQENLWKGLETIKDGEYSDKRNVAKHASRKRPMLIIFSNGMPDRRKLTADRLKIWMIAEDKLVTWTRELEAMQEEARLEQEMLEEAEKKLAARTDASSSAIASAQRLTQELREKRLETELKLKWAEDAERAKLREDPARAKAQEEAERALTERKRKERQDRLKRKHEQNMEKLRDKRELERMRAEDKDNKREEEEHQRWKSSTRQKRPRRRRQSDEPDEDEEEENPLTSSQPPPSSPPY